MIGVTCHWVRSNWTAGCAMPDLIDMKSYLASDVISAQTVLTAVQKRCPYSTQLLVTTTFNAALTRLKGDALAGEGGFGCICHYISLALKK